MFSALRFLCPANWLLVGSMYAENICNLSLKLIAICASMEGSAKRRDLQSEITNDHLSCHGLCAWDKQVLGRRRNLRDCTVCILLRAQLSSVLSRWVFSLLVSPNTV